MRTPTCGAFPHVHSGDCIDSNCRGLNVLNISAEFGSLRVVCWTFPQLGVWAAQITAKFGSRFDSVAIQKACTWLVNEGHAFEVTDNYYKSISAS